MQDSRPLPVDVPVDVPVDAPAMDGRMAGATDAVDDVAEDLRFSFAGERVDGEAGAAFLEQLEQAKAREQADEDAQEIRRSTGWERGLDGMWRLEVSDERAHLKESRFVNAWLEGRAVPRGMLSRKDQSRLRDLQERLEDLEGRVFAAPAAERQTAQWDALFDEYRAVNDEVENLLRLQRGELRYLEDVLEHPELFALYPQARRIWVSLLLDKTPSEEWSPRMEGSLTMGLGVDGPDFSLAKIRLVAGNREQMLSGLLHEVQHAIQLYEGFAEGDSTANYLPPSPESGERMRRLVALDDAARERQVAPEQFAALAGYEPEVVQRVQELVSRSLWEQNVQDWRTSLLTPFQRYRRAAGEVEARNVQTRMGMTQEQRRDTPPQQTEDVAREDQFVLYRRSRMAGGAALEAAGEVRNEMRNEAPDDGVRDGAAPSVMEELLEQARQMREQREALVQDLQQQLEAGQMQVFHDPEGLNSGGLVLTLSPSAQREGWVQVTRYNDSGMLGDGQYKSVDEAVRGDMLHRMRKMRPQQAQEVMQRLLEAEMRYQGMREQASGEQAEAVAPSMVAGMTTGAGMAVAARPRRQPRPSAQVDQIREALRSQHGDLVDALESRGHLVLAGSARETLELLARRHAQLHDKPVEWARARLRGLNVDTTALQGFFDRETGAVFMVADHLTERTAAPVLLHEMGMHMRYALKQKDARLGPLFRGMFIRARRMVMEPGGDPLLRQVQERMLAVGVMTRAQLARGEFSGEEAAAYIAELHVQQPGVGGRGVRAWMGRLVAGVRAWLYERTGLLRTSSMRPADIAAIARSGLGDVAGRERARDDSGQPPGVLPSMAAGQVEDDPPQPVASPVASPVSEGAASDQDDQDQGGNQKGGAKEGDKPAPRPGSVGMLAQSGEVFLTTSGRPTTAFPRFDEASLSTSRKATNVLYKSHVWLVENALQEALARGDRHMESAFRHLLRDRTKGGKGARSARELMFSPTDLDAAELYLFDPDFLLPVPRPLLKPLVTQEQEQEQEQRSGDMGTARALFARRFGRPPQPGAEAFVAEAFVAEASPAADPAVDSVSNPDLRLSLAATGGEEVAEGVQAAQTALAPAPAPGREQLPDQSPDLGGPRTNPLVVLHNLSEDNLRHAHQLGGLPAPSLGITRLHDPFLSFGTITLMGDSSMVDPRRGVPVFDRDVWTARYPELLYTRPRRGSAQALYDQATGLLERAQIQGLDESRFRVMLWSSLMQSSYPSPDNVREVFQRYQAPRLAYAREVLGLDLRIPMQPVRSEEPFGHDRTWRSFVRKTDWSVLDNAPDSDQAQQLLAQATRVVLHAMENVIDRAWKEGASSAEYVRLLQDMRAHMLDERGLLKLSVLHSGRRDAHGYGTQRVDEGRLRERLDRAVSAQDRGYLDWVDAQVQPLFDAPRIRLGGRKVPATLENITRWMITGSVVGAENAENGSTIMSNMRVAAHLGRRFFSLGQIQGARAALAPDDQADRQLDALNRQATLLQEHALQFYTGRTWRGTVDVFDANAAINEVVARQGEKAVSDEGIRRRLEQQGFGEMPDGDPIFEMVREVAQGYRALATSLFEAKPRRAVTLDEFRGAVVPRGTAPDVLEMLRGHGLEVVFHGKGQEARRQAIRRLGEKLQKEVRREERRTRRAGKRSNLAGQVLFSLDDTVSQAASHEDESFAPAASVAPAPAPAPVTSAPGLRLAPNGKPSNLAPHLYAMVRTREFKEWFGDWEHDPQNASRALDRNGEPAVLYHGSRKSGFTEFDADMIKHGGGFFLTDSFSLAGSYSGTLDSAPLFTPAQLLENPGLLAWLTIDEGILVQVEYEDHYGYTELRWEWYEDKESALEALELAEGEELVIRSPGYLMETPEGDVFKGDRQELLQELSALRAEPQPGLYEVFVNLRDVLDVDWMGNSWMDGSQGPAEQVWNVVGADGIVLATYRDEDSAQEALDEEAGERIEMENQPLYEHSHDVSWAAQSMGCDGAILRNVVDPGSYSHGGEDGDVYIAFHPGAIKWIDNEGSFDRRNDDIRFSLRPLSGASASDEDVVDGRETAAMMDAMEGVMSENQQVQEQDRVLEQNALEQDAGIQDFGEKLGGARKDVWQERTQQMMLRISDYEVANHNLSEAWPRPDYDRLIESGMSSLDVAHVRALRDILEARPRSSSGWRSTYKLGVWAQDVILLRGMAADLLSGRLGWQDVASQLRMRTGDDMPEHRIDRIGYLAGLYNLAGHEADLSDIVRYRVRQGVGDDPALQEYRYYSSKKIKSGPLQGESVDVRGVGAEGALAAFDQMLQKQRALLEQQQARAAADAATEAAEGGVGAQGEQADGKPTRGRGKEYEAKDFPCYREAGPKAREGIFIGRYIGKSMACLAGPFDKLIPALEWRLDNVAELNERLRKYRDIPSERGEKNEPRSGLAYRDAGQGVEPQEFLDAFGFRGVEFGNWVSQSRRQKDLDQAHDALQDMCRVLGLDSTSVGLGNRLGLAFGARGLGGRNGVAAHYESDHTAINLTKTSGAGSLAHEWWHALDQHMVRVATRDASKYAFGTQTGVPCHQYEEYSDLHRFVERLRHQLSGALRTRSLELDSRRTNRYFSLPEELSARAFEGWIKWELEQLGERNDYLVNIRDEPDWEKRAEMGMNLDNSYPYPTRQEMPALAETFREIVRAACEAGILKPAEAAQEQQPEAVRQRQAD